MAYQRLDVRVGGGKYRFVESDAGDGIVARWNGAAWDTIATYARRGNECRWAWNVPDAILTAVTQWTTPASSTLPMLPVGQDGAPS